MTESIHTALRTVLRSRLGDQIEDQNAAQLSEEIEKLRAENTTQLQQLKSSAECMAQLCNAVQQRELEILYLRRSHEQVVHELRLHATQMFQLYEKCISEHHSSCDASHPPDAKQAILEPNALQHFKTHHPQLLTCTSCLDNVLIYHSVCMTPGGSHPLSTNTPSSTASTSTLPDPSTEKNSFTTEIPNDEHLNPFRDD